MDKEKQPKFESGFSEKQSDLAVDRASNNVQAKSGNIFDPQKKSKKSKTPITDSQNQ